jgi:hypothetical protein
MISGAIDLPLRLLCCWLNRKTQSDGIEYRDQRFQRRVPFRRQRSVERFTADAGLRCDFAEATAGLRHRALGQKAAGAFVGVVECLHRGLQIRDHQFRVGRQFGDFAVVVGHGRPKGGCG